MNIRTAREFTTQIIKEHGLNVLGWHFHLSHGKTRLGYCHYQLRRISISKYLIELGKDEEVIDTILHEIAHALTPGCKHNWTWQQVARQLGAKPRAQTHMLSYDIQHKYEVRCGKCNEVMQKRHRKMGTKRLRKLQTTYHTACGRASIGKLYMVTI